MKNKCLFASSVLFALLIFQVAGLSDFLYAQSLKQVFSDDGISGSGTATTAGNKSKFLVIAGSNIFLPPSQLNNEYKTGWGVSLEFEYKSNNLLSFYALYNINFVPYRKNISGNNFEETRRLNMISVGFKLYPFRYYYENNGFNITGGAGAFWQSGSAGLVDLGAAWELPLNKKIIASPYMKVHYSGGPANNSTIFVYTSYSAGLSLKYSF